VIVRNFVKESLGGDEVVGYVYREMGVDARLGGEVKWLTPRGM
jgi:hypothetical protein